MYFVRVNSIHKVGQYLVAVSRKFIQTTESRNFANNLLGTKKCEN
jgi:hypothetical protein